jgi:hypothetical protein
MTGDPRGGLIAEEKSAVSGSDCPFVAGAAESIVLPLQQLVDPEQKRFALRASALTQLVVRESSSELMIERSLPSSRSAHAAHGAACLETGRAGRSPTGEALPRATTS